MAEVLLMGEVMALMTADKVGALEDAENFTKSLAGAELNVCLGLTRLGHTSSYITKLGKDCFGRYIYNSLEKEGIDRSHITFDEGHPTGMVFKNKVAEGDPEIQYFRKGSAASAITPEDLGTIDFTGVKQIHVTGVLPATSQTARATTYSLVKQAKEAGVYISFDPNLRYQLWESREAMIQTINDLASYADLVLPGISEGKALMGSEDPEKIADFYQGLGAKTVIIKLGSKGAFVRDGSESSTVPGYKVEKVVDTVGAGDGFAVGVISARLEGLSMKEAAQRGNAIGALQIMVPGDNEGLPNREKLKAFMEK